MNRKYKLGVDGDGVIADLPRAFTEYRFFTTSGEKRANMDRMSHDLSFAFGETDDETKVALEDFYYTSYFHDMHTLPFAVRTIRQYQSRIDFSCITSRPVERTRSATIDWLDRNFSDNDGKSYFSGIYFSTSEPGHKKVDIARELKLDAMAEDNLDYADEFVKAGIPVFLFYGCYRNPTEKKRYQHFEEKGNGLVHCVRDWLHFKKKFEKMQNGSTN